MNEPQAASVLLVDDVPANLMALEAVLEPVGVRLVTAGSGREAVARAAREPFALVLLDVQMPEMDGFDVARQLRSTEYGRETPIIFLTAIHRDEQFARQGYGVGGADYITKPFDPDVLRARVRAFVDLFNQREALRRAQVELRTRERDEAMRQLVAFERIATAAFESDDLDAFLGRILGLLVESADAADSAAVLLRDGDELRTAVAIGGAEDDDPHRSVPIGYGIAGHVASTRRPLHVTHVATSPLAEEETPWTRGLRCLFGAPLLAQGEVVGVVQIGSRSADDFTANDRRLITLIADRAASAIVRQRSQRAELRRKELLARAGTVLASSLAVDETLARAARIALPELGQGAFIDRTSDAGAIERVASAAVGPQADALRLVLEAGPAAASGVVGDVERGEPVHIRDRDAVLSALSDDADRRAALEGLGVRSVILVPLMARGQRLGIMGLVSRERMHEADDVAAAVDLARTAALAIDNARLFELAERGKRVADEANRLKDEFLATMSHELRTPLNAILGWTSMLRRTGAHDARTQRGLEVVERSALIQRTLVEELLDVSRIVSGKMRIAIRDVDLRAAIEASLETNRPAADAKGIHLIAQLVDGVTIAADPDRLQQVLSNLVQNAVKFTEQGGHVAVRSEREDGGVRVVVEDDGCGIEPAFLPRVFEAFRQADGSSTRAHGGLGLGLSIARHIVELHGGALVAESEGRGKGARFTLRLPERPVTEVAPRVRGGTSAEPTPGTMAGARVLIVDDEADVRELLSIAFESAGARPRTAASAKEALALLQSEPPDVLVSDIGMPGEDGYSLIRKVRQLPESSGGRTPALALTAYTRHEDRARALGAGFDMHVPKPIDGEELVTLAASLAAAGPRR